MVNIQAKGSFNQLKLSVTFSVGEWGSMSTRILFVNLEKKT